MGEGPGEQIKYRVPRIESISEEERESLMGMEVAREIKRVLDEVDAIHGRGATPDKRLAFHNREHTEGTLRRGRSLRAAVHDALLAAGKPGIDRVTELLAELAEVYHDRDQEWGIKEGPDGARIRYRVPGVSEEASAERLEAYMRDVNGKAGKEIFTAEHIRDTKEAIMATVTVVDGTGVRRPNMLDPEHPPKLLTIGLAYGDLGSIGMEGFETSQMGQRAYFFETNMDITIAIGNSLNTGKVIPVETKELYWGRIRSWLYAQKDFITGWRDEFERELEIIDPPQVRDALRARFDKFDETIQGHGADIQEFEKLTSANFDDYIDRMRANLAFFENIGQ
jgi:hypothetical protein